MRAFRSMHKIVQTKNDELKTICNQNKYTLDFIESHAQLAASSASSSASTPPDSKTKSAEVN
jgi:hypothetical protein